VKPNQPNTDSENKIFARLGRLSIVGNYITQDEPVNIIPSVRREIEDIITTNPSLIKGEKGDKGDKGEDFPLPEIPKLGIYVLGASDGKLVWFKTQDCG
jgi:ABC-type Fe3+-hydroxamate transport system substrate-binding protein